MTFKDTKYLFSKSQLSLITAALTDNLELPDVLRSVSKRVIDIDNELESCVESGFAYYDEHHVLSPNFDLLDGIVDNEDRSKTMVTLYHIVDIKGEKSKLGNALNLLTEFLKKGEIK